MSPVIHSNMGPFGALKFIPQGRSCDQRIYAKSLIQILRPRYFPDSSLSLLQFHKNGLGFRVKPYETCIKPDRKSCVMQCQLLSVETLQADAPRQLPFKCHTWQEVQKAHSEAGFGVWGLGFRGLGFRI